MISEMAMDDIEDMQAAGLKPTPRDIVRLNALGLRIEYASRSGDLYAMPRVAYLGKEVFREPTVAHGMWIDRVLEYVNDVDYSTNLAVKAFALSRMPEELPDATDRKKVIEAINGYCAGDLSKFTRDQIRCAVIFAIHGSSAIEWEYPAPNPYKDEAEEVDTFSDAPSSVYVGVLLECVAIGLGMSLRDYSQLTISQAKMVQTLAMYSKGVDPSKRRVPEAQVNYYNTRDEIRKRLEKELKDGVRKD